MSWTISAIAWSAARSLESYDIRALGCMGGGAICEFGSTDPEIAALRTKVTAPLTQ
jgi:hypothetical protein